MAVPPGELRIQVIDDELIVSLPQSSYAVTYYKPANSPQLLARRIPMEDDPRVPMTLSEFLGRAWWAANDKARELGWIS
jgi:hypothetical protein